MSSFAQRHNKQRVFDIDTTGFEYFKLSDLYKQNGAGFQYPIKGFYINTMSKFGDAPVIATDKFFVNLPANMLDEIQNILSDDSDIETIRAGKVGFIIREYTNKKYNRVCYSIKFIDIEPNN